MKKLAKYEDKLLACVPEKWAKFYKNAPNEFRQDLIVKSGYTREQFLELAKATGLFDVGFYERDPSDLVYKQVDYMPSDCESWFLNEQEMALYQAMPAQFTQDELRDKRLEMKLPVGSQDKMVDGTLFKHIKLEGKIYFDLEKGIIRPVLK